MPNNDLKLLIDTLEKIQKIKALQGSNIISNREEFSCNDSYIKAGLGALIELVNTTNKINATTVLISPYLTKELPMLNRYKECIFNPDNSINAYKLFDFLTLEITTLEEEIKKLITK
ncbi:MAG: hypothetical protein IKJ30_05795 [Bacilli bacterium]|nr:hypothetical protein [Bacilli bacterium]